MVVAVTAGEIPVELSMLGLLLHLLAAVKSPGLPVVQPQEERGLAVAPRALNPASLWPLVARLHELLEVHQVPARVGRIVAVPLHRQ